MGSAAVLAAVAAADSARAAGSAPEWEHLLSVLRRRWYEVTAGVVPEPGAEPYRGALARMGAKAARHRDRMTVRGDRLWADLAFPAFDAVPRRLLAMARAYALPGTGVTGDARLGAAVAEGIDEYRRRVYAAGAEPVGNWWHWQIGVPMRLLDAALLVGPHLDEERRGALLAAVDHFVPERVVASYSGTSTGANRVDLCTVLLLRAMLAGDQGGAATAVAALAPVFGYVREGDGFYRDGSFLQHTTVPYQGTYGAALLEGLARLLAVLRGTPWRISAEQRRFVWDVVERSFAPVVHDGFCMDIVAGRAIGRRSFGDHQRGRRIAAAILLLAESAPAELAARWRAMVKGWALRDTVVPMLRAAEREDLAFHARLAAVLRDDGIPAGAEPYGHRLLAMSARAVHRRPGWCAALSMASHRVAHYEHGNGENRRGWHTGAGMLYWWAEGHGDQYSDGFWATVDPYRLPGTTVSAKRLADGAGGEWGENCPPARWVGGATNGEYAAVGQHRYGLASTLEAFTSWFFLDDAVVCLGAGISCADGVPVATIVDNRRTDAALTVGETGSWAHLAGHGGYVLLDDARLRIRRERRTGNPRFGINGADGDGDADGVAPGVAQGVAAARITPVFAALADVESGRTRPPLGIASDLAAARTSPVSAALADVESGHIQPPLDAGSGSGDPAASGVARVSPSRTTSDADQVRTDARPERDVTREYVTLWLDHGVDPRAASYRYLLLPGATLAETRARAAQQGRLAVLGNTADAQGVHVPSLGLTAVNFWQPGSLGGLTVSGPCSVLVRRHAGGTATIAVADPRCDLRELTVTWDQPVAGVVRGAPRVAAVATGRRLTLRYTGLADAEGASIQVTVRMA